VHIAVYISYVCTCKCRFAVHVYSLIYDMCNTYTLMHWTTHITYTYVYTYTCVIIRTCFAVHIYNCATVHIYSWAYQYVVTATWNTHIHTWKTIQRSISTYFCCAHWQLCNYTYTQLSISKRNIAKLKHTHQHVSIQSCGHAHLNLHTNSHAYMCGVQVCNDVYVCPMNHYWRDLNPAET